MSVASILRDIFDAKREKANLKLKNLPKDKAALYRSFVIEVPNVPFTYGFIYTGNGIEEIPFPNTANPTLKAILPYEVLSKILRKEISLHDAIYAGLVKLKGENPQLHINILLTFFGDLV
jgi:hypothetical protein